jgi:hypothetical protein
MNLHLLPLLLYVDCQSIANVELSISCYIC